MSGQAARSWLVNAFTTSLEGGNPAAVCPLERWPGEAEMQAIATRNGLSETAFFVARADGDLDLRWFTPACEVDLCGHATLASAAVLWERLGHGGARVRFHTRSGALEVKRRAGGWYQLDMPAYRVTDAAAGAVDALAGALGRRPAAAVQARDLIAVFDRSEDVRDLAPDLAAVSALGAFAVGVTAPGGDEPIDFVSRFFAPARGVPEDPVTGSLHCALTPYWVARLGRSPLRARQLSARGGELECEAAGERVLLRGQARLVGEL